MAGYPVTLARKSVMMLPSPPLPTRAWLIVALLWGVGCLNYLDRVMLITMRVSVKEAIPMTEAQFGLLTTVFLVTYALLSPIGGFIADRWGCSRTIIFSLFVWSSITWFTAHATSFSQLLVFRMLMGVSEACYLPAAGALIAKYHGNATRSLANGIHLSGVMVGSGLGGLGGWIAERYSWTLAFELFGVIGVTYSIVLILFLRDRPMQIEPASPDLRAEPLVPSVRFTEAVRSLFSGRDFILALVFWGLLGVASWAFVGWMPTYLGEHFHLPQGKAGLISMGLIYSGMMVGMIASGAWADRWCKSNPEGRAWVGIIGLIICIPCVLLVSNTGGLWLAMVGLVLFGVSRAFPDTNMMPLLFQITDRRYRATGYGLLNACATLAGGITIYAGGVLRDSNVSITKVFYGGAAGMAICIVLLWLIRPRVIPAD